METLITERLILREIIPKVVNCLSNMDLYINFKKWKLKLLNNKVVTILYYCMFKFDYIERN